MKSNDEVRSELRGPALELRGLVPDVLKGYGEMSRAAMAPGELSVGMKELLAMMVAITRQCDGCVVTHARGLVRQGVTRQQVAEAVGVAILMNGGPGTVWGPRALHAYDEAFAERQESTTQA